jgi:ribosome-binding factor A
MARSSGGHIPSQRQLRVGEELRHALAWIFERGILRDPDLNGVMLTVTEVRVSPDLKHATAFVMPLGGQGIEQVLKGLTRVKGFLRHEVSRSVNLKFLPEFHFQADTSFEQGGRIDAILRQPEVQRDLARGREEDGDAEEPGDGA